MKKNTFQLPKRINEETKDYIKGSKERKEVIETYNSMFSEKLTFHYILEKKKFLQKIKKI